MSAPTAATAPRHPSAPEPGVRWLAVAFWSLALTFLCSALLRRLDYDESLALRAGWLQWNDVAGSPDFYMPWTQLLGALSALLADPGDLFLVLRLATVSAVLASLWWALRQTAAPPRVRLLAVSLTLGHTMFFDNGLEFRYDAAILVGGLLTFGFLLRNRRMDPLFAGVCLAWLAAHHWKGVFFAAGFFPVALYHLGRTRARAPAWFTLALGLVLGAAAWLGWVVAAGDLGRVVGFYATFFSVAREFQGQQPGPVFALWYLLEDLPWWLGSLWALSWVARSWLRREPLEPALVLAAGFGMVALLFPFAHPRPWRYMFALPAPFFAYLLATHLVDLWERRAALSRTLRRTLQVGTLAQVVLFAWSAQVAFSTTMDSQVRLLRTLQQKSQPHHRVLDPSGLAYFLPPCTRQWYTDTLFRHRRHWMADLKHVPPRQCTWALDTLRLNMVPHGFWARHRHRYLHRGRGLFRYADDGPPPKTRNDFVVEYFARRRIQSFR